MPGPLTKRRLAKGRLAKGRSTNGGPMPDTKKASPGYKTRRKPLSFKTAGRKTLPTPYA